MSTYKLSCFFLLNASLLKEYKKLKYLLTYIKSKDYLTEAFFFFNVSGIQHYLSTSVHSKE